MADGEIHKLLYNVTNKTAGSIAGIDLGPYQHKVYVDPGADTMAIIQSAKTSGIVDLAIDHLYEGPDYSRTEPHVEPTVAVEEVISNPEPEPVITTPVITEPVLENTETTTTEETKTEETVATETKTEETKAEEVKTEEPATTETVTPAKEETAPAASTTETNATNNKQLNNRR